MNSSANSPNNDRNSPSNSPNNHSSNYGYTSANNPSIPKLHVDDVVGHFDGINERIAQSIIPNQGSKFKSTLAPQLSSTPPSSTTVNNVAPDAISSIRGHISEATSAKDRGVASDLHHLLNPEDLLMESSDSDNN